MDVRWYEWKKLMSHSRGFLIFMVFILLEVLELIFSYGQDVSETGMYRPFYEKYLACVVGSVDEETAQFFSEKDEEFSQAESLLQTIYQRYSLGELTEEAYRSQLEELEQLQASKKGYDVLYEQYLYAREKPENRYLLDTYAWDSLISKDSLDLRLLIIIMIFALLCFGRENVSEMDIIIRMSINGERKTAKEKILLVILLSLSVCILDFFIQIVYFHWGYGFNHGDYPVQSLVFYSGYDGSISLMEAAFRICLFRMVGCVLWGLTVSAAIVVLRKYATSMLVTLALILLPYYGFPKQYMKYFLPGPLGFMIGTGYYQGTVFEYNEISKQEIYQFIQVPVYIKVFLVLTNILLGMLFAGIILKTYTNHWKKKEKLNRAAAFLCLLCCIPCLVGCSDNTAIPERPDALYNLDNRFYYEGKDCLVYVDYSAEEGSYIAVREKESGNTYPLVRDVFRGNKKISTEFYGEGNYIYYMERSYDNKGRYFSKLYDTFSIVRVNLDTFESQIIFQDNANQERTSVLGLGKIGKGAIFYSDIVAFVVRKDRIYFISSDKVSEVNILSGRRKTLFSYSNGNVAFDGNSFFFLDHISRLCRYSLSENCEVAVYDIAAGKFWLDRDKVLYTDREQNGALTALYFNSQEGGAEPIKKILVEEEPLVFCSDGDNLFFVPKREPIIYELESGGGRLKELGVTESAIIYPFSSYESILMPNMVDGGVVEYLK